MDKIPFWRCRFGEEEIAHVSESIRNEHISQGIVTETFERHLADVLNVPYVVATTSGSVALLMACMATGIESGDEVILPNRTWIATAHAPLLLGAKIVLTDVELDRPIMDVSQIEEKVTPKTKAIIPVHLNGRSVDMEMIHRIAQKYGLSVIEDATQSFYSKNKNGFLGCQSIAGCFSLSIPKFISTGQGGFVVTNEKEVYERLKLIRTHGVRDLFEVSFGMVGFNFKFTDILASIGIEQVKRIPERIKRYHHIYDAYESVMPELPFLKFIGVNREDGELPIYIEVLCKSRERLVRYLDKNGIQTRAFFPDLDQADHIQCNGQFPNSRRFSEQGLILPSGPEQPSQHIERVIESLRMYQTKYF